MPVTKPTSSLPEDQVHPPGQEPTSEQDNLPPPPESEVQEVPAEAPEEPAPTEGEPEPVQAEAEQEASFEPDPEFAKKFGDDKGQVDWKKVHDSYLNAEKELSRTKQAKDPEVEKLKQEAEAGRYAIYLAQKHPNLSLAQAHALEQQQQNRVQQQQQRPESDLEVEELSSEQVDERVAELMAKGKHVQAVKLAARYSPEAQAFRSDFRQRKAAEMSAQERAAQEKVREWETQLTELQKQHGELSFEAWDHMQKTLERTPKHEDVDLEFLFLHSKHKVDKQKAAPQKTATQQPQMRKPVPTVQKASSRPGPFGISDDDYIANRRSLSLNDVMGKK